MSIGNFSFTEKYTVKYAGAAAMYFVSKNLKKKYNITDERASLYEAAEQWVNALDGREFLGRFLHPATLIVRTYIRHQNSVYEYSSIKVLLCLNLASFDAMKMELIT